MGGERSMNLKEAERALRQAQRILAHPGGYAPEEWMLLATLVGEADLAIRQDPLATPTLTVLLEEVIAELREVTNDFTDPAFLSGSRAARRRNKNLFSGTV
jgi:hypothetical protein